MQSKNSEYGSPYLATHNFNHFAPDCFLNEGQFKASFVKREGRGEQFLTR